MPIMAAEEPVTLKEVQLRLGMPQHILIHLCEKGVIEPDFTETSGRGKRREFSRRNLFEFAVALTLRKFELPVAMTAFVIRLLRSFERAMLKPVPGFALPGFLLEHGIELILHFYDGHFLVFHASGSGLRRPLLLGVDISEASKEAGSRPRIEKLDELPTRFDAQLEINLTRIAKRVFE